MLRYIFMRLGYFVLTFVVVSIALFALSRLAPGDAIDNLLGNPKDAPGLVDFDTYQQNRKAIAKKYNLDLPPFYFTVAPSIIPKRLYSIPSRSERTWLRKLIYKYRNAEHASSFVKNFKHLELLIRRGQFNNLRKEISKLKYVHDENELARFNKFLRLLDIEKGSQIEKVQFNLSTNIDNLISSIQKNSLSQILIPKLHWHGIDNQYHRWFGSFVKGDFGLSIYDRRPVKSRIWEALGWTLLINICSIFLAFLISIPLGVYAARQPGSSLDKFISLSSMMLYALPVFWIATLSITFFASDEWLHWFPSGGLGKGNTSGLSRFIEIIHHLFLPVLCVTYVALAFIIRQVRGAMQDTMDKDFIKTAQAKGLVDKEVLWKHGFRNSLTPLITMFSSLLPATIAGSVVVEIIFSIPGMGRLVFNAILQQDWNVAFTTLLLGTVLTLIGNLLADILYAKVDPRVSLTKETVANV